MKRTVISVVLFCTGWLVFSLWLASPSAATVDPTTAVGIWLFDQEKANPVQDRSGNGNDANVQNPPEWIEGPFGKAVEFAASGQAIVVADTPILNFGKESFSVVVWFNFSTPQDWNRLVRERQPSPWGSGNYGWELQTQGTRIHWSLDDAAGHHKKNSYDNAGDGEWHHTVMVVDREEEQLITYVDGANQKMVEIPEIESVTGPLPVTIGGGIVGALDEVGIFATVLSEEDVLDVMTLGLQEILQGAAVEPADRLATTWGDLKR